MTKRRKIVEVGNYLYILSDDEIKEGDWLYDGYIKAYKARKIEVETTNHNDKKIIATTDPNLIVKVPYFDGRGNNVRLPQIPQSLIEYYAKYQPEEVELEYDSDGAIIYGCGVEIWEKLKLHNNEVVWVDEDEYHIKELNSAMNKFYMERGMKEPAETVEEKLFNREEVNKLIVEGIKDFCEMNPLLRGCQVTDFEIEEWRKENL